MKIFLLGLPGSGKTTYGKAIAEAMDLTFVDLDKEIEKESGMSVRQIFEKHKEDHFRKLESKQLQAWCQSKEDFVMATGGGTPCFADNLSVINLSGTSIFLDAPSRIIAERIAKSDLKSRPLFAGVHPENLKDAIEFMRSQRITFYQQANLTIGPETSVEEVVAVIRRGSRA